MIRKKACLIVSLLFFSILLSCGWIFPVEKIPSITGVVKDSMGKILSGVDIFVSPDNFNEIVLRARTDHKGRFFIRGISPGIYKIAAAKNGYQTGIKNINLKEGRSSDLILEPLSDGLSERWKDRHPEKMDWVRRVPKKDMLKELEESISPDQNRSYEKKDRSSSSAHDPYFLHEIFSLPFRVELKQLISRELNGEESLESRDKTHQTEISLSGKMAGDGHFRVEAIKNRWRESLLYSPQTDLLERNAETLGVDGQYHFGKKGTLRFSTFYEKDRLDIIKESFSETVSSSGIQKGWGYSAAWRKKIDDNIQLDVHLIHAGSEFKGHSIGSEVSNQNNGALAIENQIIHADGKFQANLFDDHKIRIGLETHYHNSSSESARIFPFYNKDLYYVTDPKEGGYYLALYGKDSWMVKAVTISYGLQYYHFFFSEARQILSPVFEIEYQGKSGSSMRAEVSYVINGDLHEARLFDGMSGNRMPSSGGNLSFKAEIEKRLGEGSSIKASMAYIPWLLLNMGRYPSMMAWEDSLLYMTDGNASSLSAGTFFEKKFRFMNGGIGFNYGTIEGTFSSILPNDFPLQILREGDLDYLLAILKASSSKTNTEIFMKLRKVRDQSSAQGLRNNWPLEYSLISLQLSQKVPVFHTKEVILKALLEYDDTLSMNEIIGDVERSLLPYKRISGGIQLAF